MNQTQKSRIEAEEKRITRIEAGKEIHVGGESATVGPSCGEKRGYWYCATHREAFKNQFEKDSHIRRGRHELAWLCPVHGAEVP